MSKEDMLYSKIYELQAENKQLKSILTELEEWLNKNESFDDYCNETTFTSVLDKIQKLKEKYK